SDLGPTARPAPSRRRLRSPGWPPTVRRETRGCRRRRRRSGRALVPARRPERSRRPKTPRPPFPAGAAVRWRSGDARACPPGWIRGRWRPGSSPRPMDGHGDVPERNRDGGLGLVDGHGHSLHAAVLQHQVGDPLGDRLDQVPPLSGYPLVDLLGEAAVVDRGGQGVAAGGLSQVDVDLDVDREQLAVSLLLVEHAVMGEHFDAPHGDAVAHPPTGGTSLRPSGPSGRPRISWTTAMARIESFSNPAWRR